MSALIVASCDGCPNRSDAIGDDPDHVAARIVHPPGWLRITVYTPPPDGQEYGAMIEKHFCQECAPHVRIVVNKEKEPVDA